MTATLVPMRPGSYSDHVSKVRWDNATAQPELSGQRCFAYLEKDAVKIVTDSGVTIKSVPHINASLLHPFRQRSETVLDGFLVSDALSENELKKYLKKANGKDTTIRFLICDQVADGPFMGRFKTLEYFVSGPVACVETVKIRNREDLGYYQSRCLAFGYKGMCLRHSADSYRQGDATCLLTVNTAKYKDFPVNDFKLGSGDFAGLGMIICETPDGDEFEVVCPKQLMTVDALLQRFKTKPFFKLKIAYFDYTLGADCVPRFPVAIKFQ